MSINKTKQVEIDGKNYICHMWPAEKGLEIFQELGKILGEPFGMIMMNGLDGTIDGQTLGKSIGNVFNLMQPKDLVRFTKEIVEGVTLTEENGVQRSITKITFNIDFMGQFTHLFKLCLENLKFQFDFLSGLAAPQPGTAQGEPKGQVIRAL